MQEFLDSFVLYMAGAKESSYNTVVSYKRDILKYIEYLKENGIYKLSQADRMTVVTYLLQMKRNGKVNKSGLLTLTCTDAPCSSVASRRLEIL